MDYKIPENVKKASALMLQYIIEKYDGPTEVAKKAKRSRQVVHSFLTYGYIPLRQTYHFSKVLKVSQWAVSYVMLMDIFGEQSLPLDTVVKELTILDPTEKEEILKLFKKK